MMGVISVTSLYKQAAAESPRSHTQVPEPQNKLILYQQLEKEQYSSPASGQSLPPTLCGKGHVFFRSVVLFSKRRAY